MSTTDNPKEKHGGILQIISELEKKLSIIGGEMEHEHR